MLEMTPACEAVPAARSTTTPAVSADRSSVSLPPPPAVAATPPPANAKTSAPEPPARFSNRRNDTPATLPELAPETSNVAPAAGPINVFEPAPPTTDARFETPPVPVASPVARSTVTALVYAE